MAPHSSTLAWKIPWTEEPGRLQSMGSLRVEHDWAASISCIGEGNGNSLQFSCLENPRDGGAWWAAINGVTQSRTRLKRLSSSSSRATKQQHYLFPELSALISLRMLLIELVLLEDGITKWVAISFSDARKWKVKVKSLHCVWLFATPWTAAHQAPLPMGFSRQEHWSGVPSPSPV